MVGKGRVGLVSVMEKGGLIAALYRYPELLSFNLDRSRYDQWGHGFSIGALTMLPHSVQDPS